MRLTSETVHGHYHMLAAREEPASPHFHDSGFPCFHAHRALLSSSSMDVGVINEEYIEQ